MKSAPEPLVSVILPVYNVEKYLGECLDSILNQTYKNLEIICVNDGTPDKSEEIIDIYVAKDNRVKKINQKNKGLNLARETGFKNSTGNYIMFVDSDDVIHHQTIEIALDNIYDTKSDISIFGYKQFAKDVSEVGPVIDNNLKVFKGIKGAFRYLLVNDPEFVKTTMQLTVWGKLYKRRILANIDWHKSNYRHHEDLFWTPLAFSEIQKGICVNSSELYLYRCDPRRSTSRTVVDGEMLNGKPIGHLELTHNFCQLLDQILRAKNIKESLEREFNDAAYDIYRGNLESVIDANIVSAENNARFIPEYHQFSTEHIRRLNELIVVQDRQIKNMDLKIKDLEKKLDPESASIKHLATTTLGTTKHRLKQKFSINTKSE